ncbi:hypothetical protein P9112_007524 [Eukaryota sp. TZLM1-RC]
MLGEISKSTFSFLFEVISQSANLTKPSCSFSTIYRHVIPPLLFMILSFLHDTFLQLHYKVGDKYMAGPNDIYTMITGTVFVALCYYVFVNTLSVSSLRIPVSRQKKVLHNYFFSLFYLFMTAYQLCHLHHEEWFYKPHLSLRMPWTEPDDKFIKISYSLHAGFYTFGLFLLVSSRTRDPNFEGFWAMFCHHIVTLFLITTSLMLADQPKIGLLIQFCHNIADISLHLAKALHFSAEHNLAEVVFVLFAVTFFFTRILWFGFLLVNVFIGRHRAQLGIYFYGSPLMLLYALHCVWLLKIVDMTRSILQGRSVSAELENMTEKRPVSAQEVVEKIS